MRKKKKKSMNKKFTKKELQRLKCTDEEIELVMEYQRRFPIILDNEDNIEKFCIDAKQLWENLDCPQGQFNKWVERKFKPYGFIQSVDFKPFGQNCPKPQGGRPENNYLLTIDMAKQLAMIDKKESGFVARRYFILMEQIVKDNKDWLDIRMPERKEYKGMCEVLSNNIYKHSARPADKYDYSREANILNIIVTGSSAQSIRNYFGLNSQNELTRDSLEKDYNEKLAFLQKQNMIYLGMDMPIVERVKMLIASFDIIYPIASPILPWMSKEDMLKARTKLIDSLSI